MTDLLSLIEERPTPTIDRSLPLAVQFETWAALHPDVLRFIERRALDKVRRVGVTRLSAKALVEEARASFTTTRDGRKGPFKIDNRFTSLIARWLVERHPELGSLFEMRRRRS